MGLKYSSVDYARERLTGTLVRCKGLPVIVREVASRKSVSVLTPGNFDHKVVQLEDLDLTPVPLGNVNFHGVTYVSRMPKRRDWRQGLRDNTLCVVPLGNYAGKVSVESPELVNTILNIYPSLDNCVDRVSNDDVDVQAFGRHFSVRKGKAAKLELLFKNFVVGSIAGEFGGLIIPQLDDNYSYLEELLQENLKRA